MLIKVDPNKKFSQMDSQYIQELCGLLPYWIQSSELEDEDTMKDALIRNYPFYVGPMSGGTLHSNGVYKYPQDPDLYPIMSFETETELCFIFEYGMVGTFVKETGDTWMTRMD